MVESTKNHLVAKKHIDGPCLEDDPAFLNHDTSTTPKNIDLKQWAKTSSLLLIFLGGEVRENLIRLGIQGPHVWTILSLWNHSYLPKKKPQIKSLFQGFIAIKYPFIGPNWPYFLKMPIGCVVRVARILIR